MDKREKIEAAADDRTYFGFWIYLMTDLLMFAVLFASYAVLHNNTFGGPTGAEIFKLPGVLLETIILLTSSFTTGLGLLAAKREDNRQTVIFFSLTFLLGLAFLSLELTEFRHLVIEGNSWTRSAFLSSFFSLVGTHGLHIFVGLVWLSILMFRYLQGGFTHSLKRKLTLFSFFWHFLDLVWIFIFTMVYLMA